MMVGPLAGKYDALCWAGAGLDASKGGQIRERPAGEVDSPKTGAKSFPGLLCEEGFPKRDSKASQVCRGF